ncbi:ATPase [Aureimonas sp. Leaf454]|uniref:ATP12 family chaperone protein n=1 Tax=Aureimonas sp. Leaf454 TaxID=1736381 RepID=UPI0006F1C5B8|nr:ATP12 family protein [Aureimonas sp. Leaf454]KQT48671.1 ATPase [Aureimonas sp. Leaf454]
MSGAPSRPELPKRFYETVDVVAVDGGHTVRLDGRGVKTPARRALLVPAEAVAEVMASEWRVQGERIDPATMPMTRLVNTVIDGIADTAIETRTDLARYVETDLLFYRVGEPARLVARQQTIWDPILKGAEASLGRRFLLAEGVMHVAQPPESLAAFRSRIDAIEDPFVIAALHQITTLTGSAIIAHEILERRLTAESAWAAAHVDEDWNIELWGEDEEADRRRRARFVDMRTAVDLLHAVPGARLP